MLKFRHNSEIDKTKWDNCINQSSQNIMTARSWFLDIVSPGWCAYIFEDQEFYLYVVPIPIKRKFGIPYVYQPIFTQQLGIFSLEDNDKYLLLLCMEKLSKRYIKINDHFNVCNNSLLQKSVFAGHLSPRTNYLLQLNKTYEEVHKGFSGERKRNIKKAELNNLQVCESEDFKSLLQLFRQMNGNKLIVIKDADYINLEAIYHHCKNEKKAVLYLTKNEKNEILAGGLFLIYENKVIYILGAISEAGRTLGAMILILNEVIKKYSGYNYIFDFEGGQVSSIGWFFKSFGATPIQYLTLNYKRFPFM